MTTIDRNSKNFSYLTQLGILLGLVGAGMIIGSIVSVIVWLMLTGRPILSMTEDLLKPQYYNAVMTIQVVSTFFIFFAPVYIFCAYLLPKAGQIYRVQYQYKLQTGFYSPRHSSTNFSTIRCIGRTE